MTTEGTVREWHADEGWGVLDSAATPGGCWAHFSAAAMAGYVAFAAGDRVRLEWERAEQDGYSYRAVRFWPYGSEPADRGGALPSVAYTSTLTLHFDEPRPENPA